jgi:hypothetical protein
LAIALLLAQLYVVLPSLVSVMFCDAEVFTVTFPKLRLVLLQRGTAVCVVQVTMLAAGAVVAPVGVKLWLCPMPATLVAAVTTMLQLAPAAIAEQLLLVTLKGALSVGVFNVIAVLPSLR